jgi:acetyltransferase
VFLCIKKDAVNDLVLQNRFEIVDTTQLPWLGDDHWRLPLQARDGHQYWLRPIRREDAPALQRAYAKMTPADRHARLFASIPALTDQAALAFCTVEPHEVCLVLEREDEPGELLGGGRLMGTRGEASAEFAVSLRSDLKGRGLGKAMLKQLLEIAPLTGVERVWGSVLATNTAMKTVAEHLGFKAERDPEDFSLLKLELLLDKD